MENGNDSDHLEQLLDTPGLADALESERFKQFLDHVPVAIAVSELHPSEVITYCNFEFERLTGRSAADIQGNNWKILPGIAAPRDDEFRWPKRLRTIKSTSARSSSLMRAATPR